MPTKTEKQERTPEERLTWLLDNSKQGWMNPYLKLLAASGPNPKAVDNNTTKRMGWPEDLGRQLRAMVTMRDNEAYRSTWNSLMADGNTVKGFPSSLFFDFEPDEGLSETEVVESNVNFKLGGFASNRKHWPLLLREFRLPTEPAMTSFDGTGSHALDVQENFASEHLLWGMDYRISAPHLSGKQICAQNITIEFREASFPHGSQMICRFLNSLGNLVVWTKNIIIQRPQAYEPFPALFKLVVMEMPATSERIELAVRQDCNYEGFQGVYGSSVGQAFYKKRVFVSEDVEVCVEAEYNIDNCLDLCPVTENVKPIVIRFTKEWENFIHGGSKDVLSEENLESVVRSLAKVAGPIFEQGRAISLEQVLGKKVFDTPPSTLAELLHYRADAT